MLLSERRTSKKCIVSIYGPFADSGSIAWCILIETVRLAARAPRMGEKVIVNICDEFRDEFYDMFKIYI